MNAAVPTAAVPPLDPAPLIPLLKRMVGDEKHLVASQDVLPVMWALYAHVLRVDPNRPESAQRDRFLLSKGHGPMAYYAALAWRGFFPAAWLDRFLAYDGALGAHPDRRLIPGVEISSGSLGHGLPLAVGTRLGLSARGLSRPRVFCLLGDGELDEGSNHEAIAYAGRAQLDRLVAIVVDNQSARHGWPGGIGARFEVEGWQSASVSASDGPGLIEALDAQSTGPRVVIVRSKRKET